MKRNTPFRWWPLVLTLFALWGCTQRGPATSAATVGLPTPIPSPSPTNLTLATPEPTPSPPPAAAAAVPTETPSPQQGRITGLVWEDVCPPEGGERCKTHPEAGQVGDGIHQPDEWALASVVVKLAQGVCPGTPMSVTVTNGQGFFAFENLAPGPYCVTVDVQDPQNAALLNPGVWTMPADAGSGTASQTVDVPAGGAITVNFGRTRIPTSTPTPAPQVVLGPSPTPQPSATPTVARPTNPYELGKPDMQDDLSVPGRYWYLRWDDLATVRGVPGRLILQAHKRDRSINPWTFSLYPPLGDAYIEVLFRTGPACRHKDRYGLIVRSPTQYEGIIFLISCDGMFKIFRWNGGLKVYQDWTRTPAIHTGARQVNRVGVWMEGNTLKLYINRALVAEIQEDMFLEGRFGLVVGADATKDFEVYVDEVAYWLLP